MLMKKSDALVRWRKKQSCLLLELHSHTRTLDGDGLDGEPKGTLPLIPPLSTKENPIHLGISRTSRILRIRWQHYSPSRETSFINTPGPFAVGSHWVNILAAPIR